MNKTLLFSDVHLKVTDAARAERAAFVAFLRGCAPDRFERLVCLGDLFDFWFEYRHAVFSDCFEVLRAFAELRDAGLELHLVCGNHDFWAGRFLRDELGFHIHREPVALPFGARCAHLAHGDGVNPRDYGYRIYKRFARNPLVIGAFRLLHPDWAMGIARLVSHSSRSMLEVEDTSAGPEAEAIREYARGVLARGEADMVLCGHAHARFLEEHPTPRGAGLYINPGAWLDRHEYMLWDGADFLPCVYRGGMVDDAANLAEQAGPGEE